ncbi:MAG: hypothetical protein IJD39_08055, partial [Clostridia bacterium]|nr:hypothetical protein [Clostridia bacterium]
MRNGHNSAGKHKNFPVFLIFKKSIKKTKIFSKKGVDKGEVVWYYNQALAREEPERVLKRAENLENDTEIRGKTTVNSGMSFNLGLVLNQKTRLRIKHKSLILAQDVRWR